MIFKVSFKETKDNPSKVVYKAGLNVNVVLKGKVELPDFWPLVPPEIQEWVANQTKIELFENMSDNTLTIFSEGLAKCRKDDKYDSLLGERLAEARAKYQIYKFFYSLCDKLYEYYGKILFGPHGVVDCGEGSCIGRDLKKYEGLYNKEAHHIEELLASKENG